MKLPAPAPQKRLRDTGEMTELTTNGLSELGVIGTFTEQWLVE